MLWLQQKYINIISSRLKRFKQKNAGLYNFACPFCNELKKSRGYFYEKNNKFIFHCHNCDRHFPFDEFISKFDYGLHDEYVFELIQDKKTEIKKVAAKEKIKIEKNPLLSLKKISQLSVNHPCKKYVMDRNISSNLHYKLYWAPSFKTWIDKFYPNKFENIENDEGRLVIPFFDKSGQFFAVQGRSLKKDTKCKYITIIFDENNPKIFGLDTVDDTQRYFVFEGPIDSLYIKNSVATAGGDITSAIRSLNKENAVIVYDNEKRNLETLNKIRKAINMELPVVIWPKDLIYKDVSDMVTKGEMNEDDILKIINKNTYCGLAAQLELEFWSNVK